MLRLSVGKEEKKGYRVVRSGRRTTKSKGATSTGWESGGWEGVSSKLTPGPVVMRVIRRSRVMSLRSRDAQAGVGKRESSEQETKQIRSEQDRKKAKFDQGTLVVAAV